MKRFSLILLAVGCAWLVRAQMDAPAPAPVAGTNAVPAETPKPPRPPTKIDSDYSADFDLTKRQAIYRGHVRVDDPEMKLTCGWLLAEVPQEGGRVNHIVAETNVVIDFTDPEGRTNHATSDKAVYVYNVENGVTNETVTLTGNPQMQNAQGMQAGDVIIWDRVNNRVHFDNPHMILRQSLNGTPAGSNSPPANAEKTAGP
jgi:lipopolysaccharide export system protein LptA